MAGGGKKRSGQGPPTLEPVVPLRHELKCVLDVTRRTVGQTAIMAPPANTCRRTHHPTRRQSNYEDAPPVDAVVQDHLLDHLPDREHLARGRKQRPIACNHAKPHQLRRRAWLWRHIRKHAQVARVRAETGQRYVGVVLRPEHPFAALGSRGKKPFESLAQCGEAGEGVVAALHGHAPLSLAGRATLVSALACNAALQHCQGKDQASGWDGQHARISHFSAERTSFVTTHAKDHIRTRNNAQLRRTQRKKDRR
jgi:hypothetical protein